MIVKCSVKTLYIINGLQINYSGKHDRRASENASDVRIPPPCQRCSVSDSRSAGRCSNRPWQDSEKGPTPKSVVLWCCQRLDLLSGLGTHFVMAAFHSTGASRRLSVVTLKMRRYTSLEMMPALRARLPRTKENSLTCASPADTIHLMYWLLLGRMRDKTSTANTNFMTTTDRVRNTSTVNS